MSSRKAIDHLKKLKTKLPGFLRRLCVGGSRRHPDHKHDDPAKSPFITQRGASYRKIHPSPCLIEPIDGGINDIKAADGNTQGSSGIELVLEPNPEKDIIGPSGIELLVEPNRSSGVESLLGPNPKELSGPSGIEMLVESNPEKQFTGSSGIELLLQPNLEKKFTGRSRIELMLEPNPEKEFAGTSGIELLREPNPEKEFTFRDLQMLTDNFAGEFSNNNFGKLYLGRIPDGWKGMEAQDVTIKIWNHDMGYRPFWDNDALNRMATEVNILSQLEMESHPNMATVEGYCFEEMNLGAFTVLSQNAHCGLL